MPESATKPRILIVDDMPINITILGDSLKDEYDITVATGGRKALSLMEGPELPDLILLDIMMPEIDGYEVCRRLKADPRTQPIPIIFISAKGETNDETYGLELGAVDYISKPFKIPIVKARIQTHIKLKFKTDILENLALVDGLTTIPNRRSFDEMLHTEWMRAWRKEVPLSLFMIDIDYFKLYNDHYGHAAGDECLKKVARVLASSIQRAGDFVARYGGEEFAVIIPDGTLSMIIQLAEKMLESVSRLRITHAYSPIAPMVTISLGVASIVPSGIIPPTKLIEMADQALYRAKQNGRNQIQYQTVAPC
ncbi:MAG: diguanylate cyclase [Candidatus Delongbacteria bacterium]|nr:diguanylate cyclase [Candidatus Delongbacteria bacterium]